MLSGNWPGIRRNKNLEDIHSAMMQLIIVLTEHKPFNSKIQSIKDHI